MNITAGQRAWVCTPAIVHVHDRTGGLTKAAHIVYKELYLLNHGGRRRVTFASRASLAKRLGMHEDTARRALARLMEAGMIERVYTSAGGRRHAHGWRIPAWIGKLVLRATRRLSPGQNWRIPTPAETVRSTKDSRGAAKRPERYPNPPPGRSKSDLRHIGGCL